ncbi:ATP-binding protein [Nannocystis sp. ILAH1]|nr:MULTISPECIES: ATP-binding protein [unclassified Nannocystis]MCY0988592.1 ATP-binding protein [Nannocystis sp. ILAH1]MCY1067444.1 ATP-binding protein [Nannocystis sp. RBIL2]
MYVGNLQDGTGVMNMALELVANAVDRALVGNCSRLDVQVEDDDSIVVRDDGPGIAADGEDGRRSLAEILERRFERPTVDGHRPHVHLGFGGAGLAAVNALSERFEIVTVHAGRRATRRYCRGVPLEPMHVESTDSPSGTRIRFRADPQIFAPIAVPQVTLFKRLLDLSFLLPQLRLSWPGAGERHGRGLAELVALSCGDALGGVARRREVVEGPEGPIDVEVALAWGDGSTDPPIFHTFVNLARTVDGTHLDGLLDALRGFFPRRGAAARRAGLSAAVAVLLADVQFGRPVRENLRTPAAQPAVRAVTTAALRAWAERWPEAAAQLRARGAG